MKKTLLGIDLGTNSIGWVLYHLDAKGKPRKVAAMGTRIFSSGRDSSDMPLNQERRQARMMSRRQDRYLGRRGHLITELTNSGLMPQDHGARNALVKLDPYKLRAAAIARPLHPHHIGRALFHLNQRRGFKSNRKTDKGGKDGLVKKSVDEFRQKIGDGTAGEFLWPIHRKKEGVRVRRSGTGKQDISPYYADRQMIADEFDAIWKRQAEADPNFFTDEKRDSLRRIIFHQRPLKPPVVGKCVLCGKADRVPSALPLFQQFRILQEVNNLRYFDSANQEHRLPDAAHADIIAKLHNQATVAFGAMEKIVRIHAPSFKELKSWGERRTILDGDETAAVLKKTLDARWNKMPFSRRNDLVALLVGYEYDDDQVRAILTGDEWGMSDAEAEKCIESEARLPSGYGRHCGECIAKLMPWLKQGKSVTEAAQAAELAPKDKKEFMSELPPYPEILGGYCVPHKTEDADAPKKWRIPNPTVHIALNQFRKVVNDIIRIHHMPAKFSLELARDLPKSAAQKREDDIDHRENEKRNRSHDEMLDEFGEKRNRENRVKLKLWEELNSNPHERVCIYCAYCGATALPLTEPSKIGIKKLFSNQTHIDHILPKSKTMDDSTANKTLACRKCNNDKGDRTPFEAFGMDEERYQAILERAAEIGRKQLHHSLLEKAKLAKKEGRWKRYKSLTAQAERAEKIGPKLWRFEEHAMERLLSAGEHKDFHARQLSDTRYIAKAARRYLERIANGNDILVIPGRLTALLRHAWGLNSVLDEIRGEGSGDGKNRNDHRHHAIDAAVVGTTNRSLLQKITTNAKKMEHAQLSDFANAVPEPMPNFRAMVKAAAEKIIVSHKPNRKREGKLHKETAYGIVGEADKTGKREVVHRLPLLGAEEQRLLQKKDIPKIRDPKLRQKIEDTVDFEMGKGLNFRQAREKFAADNRMRRVRVVERLSVIPLPENNPFKAYWGRNNWAYEIFAVPDGKGGEKWNGEIITTFDANKYRRKTNRGKKIKVHTHIPRWRKKHPDAKLVMRIHGGDMIALGEKGASRPRLFRVQKISDGDINLAEHFEANAAARHSKKDDEFKFVRIKSAEGLRKRGARKIHISPAGLVNDPGPPPAKKK